MLSRKGLNSAELEIVRVSKSPTTVFALQPIEKCKRMMRQQCMAKNWIHS